MTALVFTFAGLGFVILLVLLVCVGLGAVIGANRALPARHRRPCEDWEDTHG